MTEAHSSDYPNEGVNAFGFEFPIGDDANEASDSSYAAVDSYYSPGIIPDEMSDGVQEFPDASYESATSIDVPEQDARPGLDTENPFRRESEVLSDGWVYTTHEQMVIRWHDERESHVAAARTFGAITLRYYDKAHNNARILHQEDSEWLRNSDETTRQELEGLRTVLRSSADDDNIVKSLVEHLPFPEMESTLTQNGTRPITEGIAELDDEAFMDFLRLRSKSVTAKCEMLEAGRFEPMTARFKARVADAITEQHLPLDFQTAMTRLDNIKVIYADPLRGVGKFAPETGVVTLGLDESYDEATLEGAVWHELEHALVGWEPAIDEEYGFILNQRAGLQHHSVGGIEYARWMNEVVTDKMSLLLKDETIDYATLSSKELTSKDRAAPHYVDEEPLMAFLLNGPNGQVAFYDVLAAYYENYDANAPDGERSPKIKQLYAQLDNAWGGFEEIAPVIYDADRENRTGSDREPETLPYTKALHTLINQYMRVRGT